MIVYCIEGKLCYLKKNKFNLLGLSIIIIGILSSFLSILFAQVKTEKENIQINPILKIQQIQKPKRDESANLPNDSVTLALIIENTGKDAIHFLESCASLDYKFLVKNESGQILSLTKEGHRLTNRSEMICRYKSSTVESNKSKQSRINLSRLYDFSIAGKYYVTVSRSIKKGENEFINLESDVVEIDIE